MERISGRADAETPSMRNAALVVWISAVISTVVICTMTYRYNMNFDIGVNHGIMSMWYAVVDLPFYVALPLLTAWISGRALRHLSIMRISVTLVVLVIMSYLLIDLHYWRYPSPVLEYSWSDVWSELFK